MSTPYHEGEAAVQRRANEVASAERNGVVIASTITRGASAFLRQQPMAVFGSQDEGGRLWASMVIGNPGFLEPSDDGRSLRILLGDAGRHPSEPLWRNITTDAPIGMLVIDLGSRRRLRINGRASATADQLLVEVDEAYPNCPKYIQRRHLRRLGSRISLVADAAHHGVMLDPERVALIRRADTFFVASRHPTRNADVSHRGGNPGFVQALDVSTLRIPDYPGNSMFNTLGNLALNPRAGLVFPDFERGTVVQLSGTGEILWDQADPNQVSGGTGRFWDFHVERWLETQIPDAIAWELLDRSPYNPQTQR